MTPRDLGIAADAFAIGAGAMLIVLAPTFVVGAAGLAAVMLGLGALLRQGG